jgi:hypothetical protein
MTHVVSINMKMISLLPPPSSWVPRYNKTLLGDKLGKFPAPLLMNTVHFALQAALSKIILLFQAKGIDAAVDMSWKDYFMRGLRIFLIRLLVSSRFGINSACSCFFLCLSYSYLQSSQLLWEQRWTST